MNILYGREGDSLWQIASRFGVTLGELQEANGIGDPGQVVIGAKLIIPGLTGVSGPLDTVTISYGETLRSLSRNYAISELTLAQLNRIVNPSQIYVGRTFIVPVLKPGSTAISSHTFYGQSLINAVLEDLIMDPCSANATWYIVALPGDISNLNLPM